MVGIAARMLVDEPAKSLGTLAGVVVSVFLMTQQMSLLTGIQGRVTRFADQRRRRLGRPGGHGEHLGARSPPGPADRA